MLPKVIHLVDDCTAGGVMQVVNFLTTSPAHAEYAVHSSLQVTRGSILPPNIAADVIVSHLALSWRTLPALMALRLRYPSHRLIHVEHSYTEGFTHHNVRRLGRFETMLRVGFGLFDQVLAVSEGQMGWLRKRRLVKPKKLGLARSFCDMSHLLTIPQRTGEIKHYGAIGRLDRQKGFDLLIKAFRQTTDPRLTLTFFGIGDQEDCLRALASGDDRIHFAGFCERPSDAYRAVDAVIMPSRWEAYGLVAIETLCAGKSLLASQIDGLVDHQKWATCPIVSLDKALFEGRSKTAMDATSRRNMHQTLLRENVEAWRISTISA